MQNNDCATKGSRWSIKTTRLYADSETAGCWNERWEFKGSRDGIQFVTIYDLFVKVTESKNRQRVINVVYIHAVSIGRE